MTLATLLGYMEIFDNELETGSGESDESRSLTALNMATDLFEVVAQTRAKMLQTYAELTTTASQEYTTRPAGLLRLDSLWLIDSATGRPARELDPIDETGGHAVDGISPLTLTSSTITGAPREYQLNSSRFLWRPVPDAVWTLRYYGLIAASDYSARTDTFPYPDAVAVPLSAFAVKMLAIGVGDSTEELHAFAEDTFAPVLKALAKSQHVKPPSRFYSRVHTT